MRTGETAGRPVHEAAGNDHRDGRDDLKHDGLLSERYRAHENSGDRSQTYDGVKPDQLVRPHTKSLEKSNHRISLL